MLCRRFSIAKYYSSIPFLYFKIVYGCFGNTNLVIGNTHLVFQNGVWVFWQYQFGNWEY